MSSAAIFTVIKLLESLPETAQEQVVEHLREYVEDLRDELEWDSVFARTQPPAARRPKARQTGNR
jgi:hypothetical protein